jgi:hypothetical protein
MTTQNSNQIFSFWFGDPEMPPNRELCYQQLFQTFQNQNIEHILVTPENIANYMTPENPPLHPAFPYLSATHKADYLRCYFMHHIGGGYTDIKTHNRPWQPAFDRLQYQPHLWFSGYREPDPGGVAPVKDSILYDILKTNYKDLIGTPNFICKPRTPFTEEWFSQLNQILYEKLPLLEKWPARHPREGAHDGKDPLYPYPIEWTEILGDIFHPLIYKYREHADYHCPQFSSTHYWR